MAYSSCASVLGANIAMDCANPPQPGFIGEGVLIDLGAVMPSVTVDSSNPRVLTAISIEEGDKVAVVDNVWRDPFSGSARTMNAESGRTTYDSTISMRVPVRDAESAKSIIEPLAQSHFIGIFPTVDKKFLVYGYYGKFQATEQTQNEGENGGDWAVTMSVNEPYAVVELKSTDYAATKAIYDALKAKAY